MSKDTILHEKGFFAPIFKVEEEGSSKHHPDSFKLPKDIVEFQTLLLKHTETQV